MRVCGQGESCCGDLCDGCQADCSTNNVDRRLWRSRFLPGGMNVPVRMRMIALVCAGKLCGNDGCGGSCELVVLGKFAMVRSVSNLGRGYLQ